LAWPLSQGNKEKVCLAFPASITIAWTRWIVIFHRTAICTLCSIWCHSALLSSPLRSGDRASLILPVFSERGLSQMSSISFKD
jgi:hypothetical protein